MQSNEIIVRRALAADIPFLIDAIVAAEKSGTDRVSYCTIFGMSEPELRAMLAEVLEEDVVGQELCVSGFMIAQSAGESVGAACSWVEGAEGKPSALLKGNLLLHFVGRERIAAASDRLRLVEELNFPRTAGILQVESVYVAESQRGRGLFGRLFDSLQAAARVKWPRTTKAHIALVKNNHAALKAYERAGFVTIAQRQSLAAGVLELLPAASKVLMEKHLG